MDEITKDYPVMFTPPGTDEAGTPEGIELLEAIAASAQHEDGYVYVSLGPKTQANLQKLIDELKRPKARPWKQRKG